MAKKSDKKGITIIRKEEVIAGGHHGGAWKVAYADFVTAMMAFFLLMWLLNATTEAQRRGLADYFSPTLASARGTSGSGKPFGGHSPFEDGPAISDRGTMVTMNANAPPVDVEDDNSDTPVFRSVHSQATDPNGKLDVVRDAGAWMRDDAGNPTNAFAHICWDGCMFPTAVMLNQQTWNDVLRAMLEVRDAHGWG